MAEKIEKPYWRSITVNRIHEPRLKEILNNIKRENLIRIAGVDVWPDQVLYVVCITKAELLLIKLSFNAKLKKIRKQKKKRIGK